MQNQLADLVYGISNSVLFHIGKENASCLDVAVMTAPLRLRHCLRPAS